MTLGPIMLDLAGPELTQEERELLAHPLVGGVILFSRNYESPEQLNALTSAIHGLRQPRLLVAVDQEGGRVQRFRTGFTALPAAASLGILYDRDARRALELAEARGWVLAAELGFVGVDLAFAPVLDLARGRSAVIGDRAFHRDPEVVARLGRASMVGMRRAGMRCVGKHFPGHGSVGADSHHTLPIDGRALAILRGQDMLPFQRLIGSGLAAIMPAHVVYSQVDSKPACFSRHWLLSILRQEMGFRGALFSDDVSMAGAASMGDFTARAEAALAAGCDMVLVCNQREGAVAILERLAFAPHPSSSLRLVSLVPRRYAECEVLAADVRYRASVEAVVALQREPELALDDGGEA
ncbi:MAG: beta-N-acetylhexosaminidase [Gammaproteobacteria bacterium]